jgi:ParB family chromosome partitioning protein
MAEPSARKLVEIPVDLLVEGEHFREVAGLKLDGLASSLQEIQLTPLIVRPLTDGRFEVLCGNLRLLAARKAGIRRLTCEVLNVNDEEALWLQLIDEFHHSPRSPLERARMLEAYIKRHGLTQAEAAKRLKLKRSTIAEFLRLLRLPPSLQALVGPLDYTTVLNIYSKLPANIRAEAARVFAERNMSQQEAKRAIALIERGDPPSIAAEKAIMGPPLKCLSCSSLRELLRRLGISEGDERLKRLAKVHEAAAKLMATLRPVGRMKKQLLIVKAGVEASIADNALRMLEEKGLISLSGEEVIVSVN